MKKCPFRTISFLLIAGALVFGSITASGAHGGRLIIWRIPGLGNDLVVDVAIDGRAAGSITFGRHFETTLSPGRHVVSVRALPQPYPRPPYTIVIDVRSGRLYNFTAKGGSNQLVLVKS